MLYTDGRFYYSKGGASAGTAPNYTNIITDSDASWFGYFRHPISQKDFPFFRFSPSYQTQVNFEPKVSKIQYGDGYTKRVSDQINTNLLTLDLTFDGLTLDEATAILHFLHKRAGKQAFIYRPGAPFSTASTDAKLFICSKWTNSNSFYNNYLIKASFEEVPS